MAAKQVEAEQDDKNFKNLPCNGNNSVNMWKGGLLFASVSYSRG